MTAKYKVVVIAYKNIEKRIIDKISMYSVKDIRNLEDLENFSSYSGKGFNMNDRVGIYMGWFKDRAKEKIMKGYEVSILELPVKTSEHQIDVIEFLDAAYEEDLVVLEKVDV